MEFADKTVAFVQRIISIAGINRAARHWPLFLRKGKGEREEEGTRVFLHYGNRLHERRPRSLDPRRPLFASGRMANMRSRDLVKSRVAHGNV